MTTPRKEGADPFVVRQESDRLDPRKLGWITGLTFLAFAAALVASSAILRAAEGGRDLGPRSPGPEEALENRRTLILGSERGITLRESQRASLERYGWADRDAGMARIPIDRAMDLLVERTTLDSGGPPP